MHSSGKLRRLRRLFTTITVAATALLGTPAVAHAGAPTGPAAGGSAKASFTAVCGTAKKAQFACFALRRDDITATKGIRPLLDLPAGYGPSDLQSAYALPANGGAGATVAIVDAGDDPNAEADLATYRQQYGLPPCTAASGCFTKSDQRGGTAYPAPDPDWSGEISLDLDMVSAVAPNAHLLLLEADTASFADMGAAVDQAVAAGAKYVSNSYGSNYSSTPGSGEDPTELTDMDVHYNHPGVAVVASSGDSDYGVSYPAASQYVTSVGGTALVRDSSTRGWSESVWHNQYGGPGSGCSVYEPKPAFQKDTGCTMRSLTDVSAVSDPATGVAVYQTYGGGGWTVYGGTSAASPIIAGVYAIAGTPVAGTYPNSYPYAATTALNDVSTGANGTCSPSYLCTAGAGYDGPTGLGTPHGAAAFGSGPHGEVAGTVTDSSTGAPLAGATVTAGDTSATTAADGTYDLSVPTGTYDVTATAYGFGSKTVPGVAVADGQKVTESFALAPVPSATVNGTVVDDSGHGWPLYARVDVDGVPGGPVFTDPGSGHFSLTLPQGADYTLHVTPVYPGYQAVTQTVTVGASAVNVTVPDKVDVTSCTAPGYKLNYHGDQQPFDGTTAPAGWSVTNADGTTGGWGFTDDGNRGNKTGGTGGFAIVDSDHLGAGKHQDTTLTGPVVDLSGQKNPILGFDTDFYALNSPAEVDLSLDGGTTWTSVWQHTDSQRGPAHVVVPLPQAAGQTTAQVRFHYTGTFAWWWEVDNVLLGSATCDPVPGGLLYGQVTDGNTGAGLVGAKVTVPDAPTATAVSAATPDDPNLDDGFYWLFSPVTGSHQVGVSKTGYTSAAKAVKIAADYATAADFALAAGQVTVTPAAITKTVAWQGTTTATLTLKNTGTVPATVKLSERPGNTKPLLAGGGAPLNKVAGKFSNKSSVVAKAQAKVKSAAPKDVTPSDAPWQAFANYPITIQDNTVAVADDGTPYSVFGYNGSADTTALYSYNADTGAWTSLAPATDAREAAQGAFAGGKLITTGGWGPGGAPDAKTEIYDPASGSWSTGAPNPGPEAAAGKAVLDGKLYVIGGCSASSCGSNSVRVYDPAANSWSTAANYPLSISWESCGALSGQIVCAGGNNDDNAYTNTYAYDPGSDTWSAKASLPIDLWGSAYAAANGQLLISGGVTDGFATITNQGYTYDPAADTWTALPNANETRYRAGSACGLYRIGGNPGGSFTPPIADSEVLPGFTQCGSTTDVSWLSESATAVTLAAGKSAKVTVTLNADVPDITQPGLYTAAIAVGSDTPYAIPAVPVSMTVNPPKTWGKIAGTVTSAVDGSALGGVTVQIDTWATSYTLKTAADGTYQLWLDTRNNPLQLIAAKDGYQPQTTQVKITKGGTTTANFILKKS
jgi:N-acetylneuraminic acid mutarotase